MLVTMLKCKLHNATVTQVRPDYQGSVAIDADLMKLANIIPNERVEIYNATNGERFATYAILAAKGSKKISVQGAAAHKVNKGDKVIICAYGQMEEKIAREYDPNIVLLDDENNITDSKIKKKIEQVIKKKAS